MLIPAFNRLLVHDEPARAKLATFSGKTVRFDFSPIVFDAQINERGFLAELPPAAVGQAPSSASPFDLKIAFPLTSAPIALLGKERVTQEMRVEGNVAMANALNGLIEHLPLAVQRESDDVLGPVLTQTLVNAGERVQKLFAGFHDSVTRNAAKSLKREDGPVPPMQEVRDWSFQVNVAMQRTEALSQRVERLLRGKGVQP